MHSAPASSVAQPPKRWACEENSPTCKQDGTQSDRPEGMGSLETRQNSKAKSNSPGCRNGFRERMLSQLKLVCETFSDEHELALEEMQKRIKTLEAPNSDEDQNDPQQKPRSKLSTNPHARTSPRSSGQVALRRITPPPPLNLKDDSKTEANVDDAALLGVVPDSGTGTCSIPTPTVAMTSTDRSVKSVGWGVVESVTTKTPQKERRESDTDQKKPRTSSSRSSSRKSLDVAGSDSEGEEDFELWPLWQELSRNKNHSVKLQCTHITLGTAGSALNMLGEDDDDDGDDARRSDLTIGGVSINQSLRCVVQNPGSVKRIVWDLICLLCVAYESVTIPMQFLELREHRADEILAWVVRIFWTMDLPFSMITGIMLPEGIAEMRAYLAIKHYLKTWFIIDFSMLIIDWLEVFMGGFGGLNAARMGKTLKSLRMLKMSRIIRFLRQNGLPQYMMAIVYMTNSESFLIFAEILKIMMFLLWINHTLACVWYGIGKSGPTGHTWLAAHTLKNQTMEYKYLTSFHWSVTQFVGTMDVGASNVNERLYSCSVLLVAFFISACVVSKITSSMTRLEIATAAQSESLYTLNQYLVDNKVPGKLAMRVKQNAQHAMLERKKHLPEASLEVLNIVTESLRVELHYEMHMQHLALHPFFRDYNRMCATVTRQVCHKAITRLSLMKGDVLFSDGEAPSQPQMYFVISGRLLYMHWKGGQTNVFSQSWACEAVLWVPWVHCGSMRVKTECVVLILDAETFQHVVHKAPMEQQQLALSYARNFLQGLNECCREDISDLTELCVEYDAEIDVPRNSKKLSRKMSGRVTRHTMGAFLAPLRTYLSTLSGSRICPVPSGEFAFNNLSPDNHNWSSQGMESGQGMDSACSSAAGQSYRPSDIGPAPAAS